MAGPARPRAWPVAPMLVVLVLLLAVSHGNSAAASTTAEPWTVTTAPYNDTHFALALVPTGTVLMPENLSSLVFSAFTTQPLDLEAPDVAPPSSPAAKTTMTSINDTRSRLASIAALTAVRRETLVLSLHPSIAVKTSTSTTTSSSSAGLNTTSFASSSPPLDPVMSFTLPTWGAVPDALVPLVTTQIVVNATAASPSWPGVALLLPYCRNTLHQRCLASGYTYALDAAAAVGPRAYDALQLKHASSAASNSSTAAHNATSNGTNVLLPLQATNPEGEVHFLTPEPHVPVVAFEVVALADNGATCVLRLNRSDILPVPRLFYDSRGNGDAVINPIRLIRPAPSSEVSVDVQHAVDGAGNDILDTFVISIDALWPFTHYQLSLALCTPESTYATHAIVFTTHVGTPTTPLRQMRLPDRSLEPTAFLVRAAAPSPATGYVHYIQAEVLDTISKQITRTRHDYGVNLGQCQGLGEVEAFYSWFINNLLPNTRYSVRARAILLPQWRSELVRVYGTFGLALPRPTSTTTPPQQLPLSSSSNTTITIAGDSAGGDNNQEEDSIEHLAAPWTPWVSTVTLQATQPALTVETQVLNATHFAVEWEKQREFAPFVRYDIIVFANDNETVANISITNPATTRVVLDHSRLRPAGASFLSVVAINALGSSPSGPRVAVPVYVDPTTEEADSSGVALSEAALSVIVAFAIIIPVIAFLVVRRYRRRMHFQFPEKDKWELDRKAIAFGREIGRGEFGIVRKGVYNEKVVAIKTLRPGTGLDQARAFIEEATVMKKLSANGGHPNIVRLHGVMMQEHPLGVVLEYLPNGSLRSLLLDSRKHHPEFLDLHQLLLFALDIANGMCYMTRKGVIHRDLAARNCLVTDDWTVKIADFGFARAPVLERNYHATYTKRGNVVLPMRWVAPEVFTDGRFCELSDVWSFGVTMWEIFSYGELPYAEVPPEKIVTEVLSGRRLPQPEHCPRLLFLLMQRCWERDRPSFSAIHTFLLTAFKKYGLSTLEGERVHPELRVSQTAHDNDSNGSSAARGAGCPGNDGDTAAIIRKGTRPEVEGEQTHSQPVSGFNDSTESSSPFMEKSNSTPSRQHRYCAGAGAGAGAVAHDDDEGGGGGGCRHDEPLHSSVPEKRHRNGRVSRSRGDSNGSGASEHDAQLDAALMRSDDDEDESTLTRLLSPGGSAVSCEHNHRHDDHHDHHDHHSKEHELHQQHTALLGGDGGEVLHVEHLLSTKEPGATQQHGRHRSVSAADSGHIHSDVDPSPPDSNPTSADGHAAASALAIAHLKATAGSAHAVTSPGAHANGTTPAALGTDAYAHGSDSIVSSGTSLSEQQPFMSRSPVKGRARKPPFYVESSIV